MSLVLRYVKKKKEEIPFENTGKKIPVQRYTDATKIPLPVYRRFENTGITGNTVSKIPVFRYTGYRCTSLLAGLSLRESISFYEM